MVVIALPTPEPAPVTMASKEQRPTYPSRWNNEPRSQELLASASVMCAGSRAGRLPTNDFSGPVTYTLEADGKAVDYTVRVGVIK